MAGIAAALAVIAVVLSSSVPRLSAADLAVVYSHLTAAGQQRNAGTAGRANMPMNCRLMVGENATCCRQMVAGQKLTCMLIASASSKPVVLVTGNLQRINMPKGRILIIAGHANRESRSGNVNMVMRKTGGHWFCAMGIQKPAVLAQYLDRFANP